MLYKEQIDDIIKRLEREKRNADYFYQTSRQLYQLELSKLLEEKIASYKRLRKTARRRKVLSPLSFDDQNRARFAMDVRYYEHNKPTYLKDL